MNDQRSLTEQLQDLIAYANANGMYDAVDYLRDILDGRLHPVVNLGSNNNQKGAVINIGDTSGRNRRNNW